MKRIQFTQIDGNSKQYYAILTIFGGLFALGMFYTFLMFWDGLGIHTGLSSRVPWGLSIIMAVYYIGLSAGSLVISALSAVFNQKQFKSFSRMGALLSILLVVAALMSITLDWGRPDRLVNPFIYLNPTSMFSINSFFYSSYMMIGFIYLLAMFSENEKWIKRIAFIAILWAVGVHSGTGYIFGSAPRELFESPLLAPSFVIAALSSGTAALILIIQITFRSLKRPLDEDIIRNLSGLLLIFAWIVVYFIAVENLGRAYLPRSREAEWFFLFGPQYHEFMAAMKTMDIGTMISSFLYLEQGCHHIAFWGGLVLLGMVVPITILMLPATKKSIKWINIASLSIVIGVVFERFIIVIPGQSVAKELIPGWHVTSDAILNGKHKFDGIAPYVPTAGEYIQAIGIASFVVVAFMLVIKFFPMLPTEARMPEDDKEVSKSEEA